MAESFAVPIGTIENRRHELMVYLKKKGARADWHRLGNFTAKVEYHSVSQEGQNKVTSYIFICRLKDSHIEFPVPVRKSDCDSSNGIYQLFKKYKEGHDAMLSRSMIGRDAANLGSFCYSAMLDYDEKPENWKTALLLDKTGHVTTEHDGSELVMYLSLIHI